MYPIWSTLVLLFQMLDMNVFLKLTDSGLFQVHFPDTKVDTFQGQLGEEKCRVVPAEPWS